MLVPELCQQELGFGKEAVVLLLAGVSSAELSI